MLMATGAQAQEIKVVFNILNESNTYATLHFESESGLNIKEMVAKGMVWTKKVPESVTIVGKNEFGYFAKLQLEGSLIVCEIMVKATTNGVTVSATPTIDILPENAPNLQITKWTKSEYNRDITPPVYEVFITLELTGTAS